MAGLIIELMNTLSDMTIYVEELIGLARTKKDIVVRNDIEALKGITARENIAVGKYQKAEKTGNSIMKDIAIVLNLNAKELTLKSLGEIIKNQSDYPAYIGIYNRLMSGLGTLKELNDLNRTLIENALEYIDYSVNVLRSTFGNDGDIMVDTKN